MAQNKSKKKLLLFLVKEKLNQEIDSNNINVPKQNDNDKTKNDKTK